MTTIQNTFKQSGLSTWGYLQEKHGWSDKELDEKKHAAKTEIKRRQSTTENGPCEEGCPQCGGIGWLRDDSLKPGDRDFGKLIPCTKRDPLSLFNLANTGLTEDEILGLNFHKLMESESKKKIQKAIESTLKRGWGWVYLWGESGNAKTLGLKIAVASLLRKGIHATYASVAEIMDDLRMAYDRSMPNHEIDARMKHWQSFPLLAIEEWGKFNETDWVAEKITQLIDHRYQSAISGQSITVFSSNEGPEDFAGYLRSRFEDGRFQVVQLDDVDLRPGMDRDKPEVWE